jgi:hypothetical protein
MPRAGFEPAIPTTTRPQTYALDCAATGIGNNNNNSNNNNTLTNDNYNTRMRYSVLFYFCIALLRSTFRSLLSGLTELGGGQRSRERLVKGGWNKETAKFRSVAWVSDYRLGGRYDAYVSNWLRGPQVTALIRVTRLHSPSTRMFVRPFWSSFASLNTHFAALVRGDRRLNAVEVYQDQPFSIFLPWRNPWNNFQVWGNPCIKKKYIYSSRYVSVISKLQI